VVTGEILGENETSLQQVLSGNNIKLILVACFIVNREVNEKHGLFKISLAMTRPQFFSLAPGKNLACSRSLPLALTFASASNLTV